MIQFYDISMRLTKHVRILSNMYDFIDIIFQGCDISGITAIMGDTTDSDCKIEDNFIAFGGSKKCKMSCQNSSGKKVSVKKPFLCRCSDNNTGTARECDWKNIEKPEKAFDKKFFAAQSDADSDLKCA